MQNKQLIFTKNVGTVTFIMHTKSQFLGGIYLICKYHLNIIKNIFMLTRDEFRVTKYIDTDTTDRRQVNL